MADRNLKETTFNQKKYDYEKEVRTEEMRRNLTSFGIMIFMTFVAFAIVAAGLSKDFVIPALLALAVIQVILQFYYFMHMKEKNHGVAKLFIMTGVFFAASFIVMALYLVWLGDPLK